MVLNVMTYNVASGRYYANDRDLKGTGRIPVDLSKSAGVIRELAPDICGINEINRFVPGYLEEKGITGTAADQPRELARMVGMDYVCFGKAIYLQGSQDYGNAVLSRIPITRWDVIPIPDPVYRDENRYYETRSITRAELDVPGGVTVLQVHVGLAVSESQNAVVTLCRILDETPGPLILMGDFNMCPDNFLLDRLRARLTEVIPEGEGYVHSFPSWTHEADIKPELKYHPYCKLDYIFVSRHFRALDCRVVPARVSDHMPMIARLELVDTDDRKAVINQ